MALVLSMDRGLLKVGMVALLAEAAKEMAELRPRDARRGNVVVAAPIGDGDRPVVHV